MSFSNQTTLKRHKKPKKSDSALSNEVIFEDPFIWFNMSDEKQTLAVEKFHENWSNKFEIARREKKERKKHEKNGSIWSF